MPRLTKATTTPLVRDLFESFFLGQIDQSGDGDAAAQGPRRTRCGVCEVCQEPDCGYCRHCRDMVKFGGSGRSKQCCVNRRCPNMALADREESDGEDLDGDLNLERLTTGRTPPRAHGIRKRARPTNWVGAPAAQEGRKTYYRKVMIEEEEISVGDCVMVEPDDPKVPVYTARVTAMWETEGRKEKLFHADWFCRGGDTILGETADPHELFLVDDCEATLIEGILRKVRLTFGPSRRGFFTLVYK